MRASERGPESEVGHRTAEVSGAEPATTHG
jgi:hypothetical protein